MGQIDWDQFKEYKESFERAEKMDNFQILLEFVRSFYNKQNAFEIYDLLSADELSRMMMQKRHISEPEHLERYLYKGV